MYLYIPDKKIHLSYSVGNMCIPLAHIILQNWIFYSGKLQTNFIKKREENKDIMC